MDLTIFKNLAEKTQNKRLKKLLEAVGNQGNLDNEKLNKYLIDTQKEIIRYANTVVENTVQDVNSAQLPMENILEHLNAIQLIAQMSQYLVPPQKQEGSNIEPEKPEMPEDKSSEPYYYLFSVNPAIKNYIDKLASMHKKQKNKLEDYRGSREQSGLMMLGDAVKQSRICDIKNAEKLLQNIIDAYDYSILQTTYPEGSNEDYAKQVSEKSFDDIVKAGKIYMNDNIAFQNRNPFPLDQFLYAVQRYIDEEHPLDQIAGGNEIYNGIITRANPDSNLLYEDPEDKLTTVEKFVALMGNISNNQLLDNDNGYDKIGNRMSYETFCFLQKPTVKEALKEATKLSADKWDVFKNILSCMAKNGLSEHVKNLEKIAPEGKKKKNGKDQITWTINLKTKERNIEKAKKREYQLKIRPKAFRAFFEDQIGKYDLENAITLLGYEDTKEGFKLLQETLKKSDSEIGAIFAKGGDQYNKLESASLSVFTFLGNRFAEEKSFVENYHALFPEGGPGFYQSLIKSESFKQLPEQTTETLKRIAERLHNKRPSLNIDDTVWADKLLKQMDEDIRLCTYLEENHVKIGTYEADKIFASFFAAEVLTTLYMNPLEVKPEELDEIQKDSNRIFETLSSPEKYDQNRKLDLAPMKELSDGNRENNAQVLKSMHAWLMMRSSLSDHMKSFKQNDPPHRRLTNNMYNDYQKRDVSNNINTAFQDFTKEIAEAKAKKEEEEKRKRLEEERNNEDAKKLTAIRDKFPDLVKTTEEADFYDVKGMISQVVQFVPRNRLNQEFNWQEKENQDNLNAVIKAIREQHEILNRDLTNSYQNKREVLQGLSYRTMNHVDKKILPLVEKYLNIFKGLKFKELNEGEIKFVKDELDDIIRFYHNYDFFRRGMPVYRPERMKEQLASDLVFEQAFQKCLSEDQTLATEGLKTITDPKAIKLATEDMLEDPAFKEWIKTEKAEDLEKKLIKFIDTKSEFLLKDYQKTAQDLQNNEKKLENDQIEKLPIENSEERLNNQNAKQDALVNNPNLIVNSQDDLNIIREEPLHDQNVKRIPKINSDTFDIYLKALKKFKEDLEDTNRWGSQSYKELLQTVQEKLNVLENLEKSNKLYQENGPGKTVMDDAKEALFKAIEEIDLAGKNYMSAHMPAEGRFNKASLSSRQQTRLSLIGEFRQLYDSIQTKDASGVAERRAEVTSPDEKFYKERIAIKMLNALAIASQKNSVDNVVDDNGRVKNDEAPGRRFQLDTDDEFRQTKIQNLLKDASFNKLLENKINAYKKQHPKAMDSDLYKAFANQDGKKLLKEYMSKKYDIPKTKKQEASKTQKTNDKIIDLKTNM